jgi:hypothetical protein
MLTYVAGVLTVAPATSELDMSICELTNLSTNLARPDNLANMMRSAFGCAAGAFLEESCHGLSPLGLERSHSLRSSGEELGEKNLMPRAMHTGGPSLEVLCFPPQTSCSYSRTHSLVMTAIGAWETSCYPRCVGGIAGMRRPPKLRNACSPFPGCLACLPVSIIAASHR